MQNLNTDHKDSGVPACGAGKSWGEATRSPTLILPGLCRGYLSCVLLNLPQKPPVTARCPGSHRTVRDSQVALSRDMRGSLCNHTTDTMQLPLATCCCMIRIHHQPPRTHLRSPLCCREACCSHRMRRSSEGRGVHAGHCLGPLKDCPRRWEGP